MSVVDLFADIIPGTSAAGFELGLKIDEFRRVAPIAKVWDRSVQIQRAIADEEGWLVMSEISHAGCNYYYNRGAVRLRFNSHDELDLIGVGEYYKGRFLGAVKVGDRLSEVSGFFDLIYDDVEELHFPSDESGVSGIIFQAAEMPLDIMPDQLINNIFIVNKDC